MKITFLLGNGFDIGLGLHTDYESFYNEYCKPQPSDNENIKSFKAILNSRNLDEQKKIVDWSDFEKAFGQHSADFTIDRKSDYIERFEDFVAKFNAYLEFEEKRADFSNADAIAKIMNTAVTTYFHIRTADREWVQNIYNSADSIRTYNFISFNYTKSVDTCARILKHHLKSERTRDVGEVLHIHGFVEENMIMGVNDASQITNPDFAVDEDVVREIVKPQQNSDVRANYERQVVDTINSSSIVCVYGMSIGDTDKKWWKHIAQWLAKSDRHALVILKYDKKYNKRFPFVQNKFVDAVISKFLELSEQTQEVQSVIRSRIFVGMNHNAFAMPLCKKVQKEDSLTEASEGAKQTIVYLNENGQLVTETIQAADQAKGFVVK